MEDLSHFHAIKAILEKLKSQKKQPEETPFFLD